MERAALAVFDEIKRQYPCSKKFLIVCGTGNNGADGFALTRLLLLDGAEVHTVLIGDRKKETDSAKSSWRSFLPMDVRYWKPFRRTPHMM